MTVLQQVNEVTLLLHREVHVHRLLRPVWSAGSKRKGTFRVALSPRHIFLIRTQPCGRILSLNDALLINPCLRPYCCASLCALFRFQRRYLLPEFVISKVRTHAAILLCELNCGILLVRFHLLLCVYVCALFGAVKSLEPLQTCHWRCIFPLSLGYVHCRFPSHLILPRTLGQDTFFSTIYLPVQRIVLLRIDEPS